jgi:hypothetical protein
MSMFATLVISNGIANTIPKSSKIKDRRVRIEKVNDYLHQYNVRVVYAMVIIGLEIEVGEERGEAASGSVKGEDTTITNGETPYLACTKETGPMHMHGWRLCL